MDSSNPYYLHPSDSPEMSLVNSIFEGKGCKAPGSDSPDLKLWDRNNNMVTSWLLNSLSKEIVDNVIYSKTAEALWKDLEDRFGQPNGANANSTELFTYLSPLPNPIYANFPDSSKDPSMKRPLALGDVKDGLYQLGSTIM
ncbi:hypothetical protein KY284_033727 [Solanum tuberosum]|nr:hypothetical protein KY284_033727 [Solanum tuberosum]